MLGSLYLTIGADSTEQGCVGGTCSMSEFSDGVFLNGDIVTNSDLGRVSAFVVVNGTFLDVGSSQVLSINPLLCQFTLESRKS